MKRKDKEKAFHQLLLHGNGVASRGLLRGKSGIALALFCHGFNESIEAVTDYAEHILEETADGISIYGPIGFAEGLSGIGWSLEYLSQHHYIDIDTAYACEEIDQRIMDFNPAMISDISFANGLTGILTYIVSHIQGCSGRKPFEDDFLRQIREVIVSIRPSVAYTSIGQEFLNTWTDNLSMLTWIYPNSYYATNSSTGSIFRWKPALPGSS